MIGELAFDAVGIWEYLREPAEFFDVPMPGPDEVSAAIAGFAATVIGGADPQLVAVSVTIAEANGAPQVLVSGTAVQPVRADAVRIGVDDSVPALHRSTDPWWRRMAARTTSRADVDQFERWLNGRGLADCQSGGVPLLGALVVETGGALVGVENPEPTSILDQLERCGAISVIDRADSTPTGVQRAWWISPRYEMHPVAEIGGASLPAPAEVVPPFARST